MSAQPLSVPPGGPSITIRRAKPEDAPACGQVCFDAFYGISTNHGFPPDFPSPDVAVGLLSMMFSHPGFYCVVAESGGRMVGSNCLDERSAIAGLGPMTVDPSIQDRGVGRKLMEAVLVRARERNFPGVRLLQSAFHNRSLALYSRLGFDAREPVSVMQGPPLRKRIEGCSVRPARAPDIEDCNRLCMQVHGHDRGGELADAMKGGTAVVVERHERITGYTTVLAFFGHAVAETNLDLQALIASAEAFAGPGIIVPTRNSDLFRWCLENGLRVVQPMTLMTLGLYNEPAGAYLPSVLF
ncbi:MAG TPA: GNAT family N-acetyltransferase [Chthoniobacterales bacterium]|nr:GNAT family N-acetyltransferase [Chthoniobacterales bacterium]